jgi:hypothetical protein
MIFSFMEAGGTGSLWASGSGNFADHSGDDNSTAAPITDKFREVAVNCPLRDGLLAIGL